MLAAIKQFFKKEVLSQPTTGEIGWENSNLYTTKDFPKYNPDDLISRKGAGIYRKMMLDDQVKAVMQFKTHAVLSRGYYFDVKKDDETGDPDIEHEKIADYYEYMIGRIKGSFSDNLSGMLSGLYNGFSISEKVYWPIMYDNKEYWGIKDIKLRPYDSFNGGFKTDLHGNLLGLVQSQGMQESKIPYGKVIHFVHQPDIDTHYGESDLRACYRSWWSKDIAIKFQNIYLERSASGFLWAKVSEGSLSTKEKSNIEDVLKNVNVATGMLMPPKVDLNSIQPNRTSAYNEAIAQHDKAIAKSILVPNLLGLSEQGNTGSYSQSQTQLNAFFWILNHIANRLEQVLNEQMFKELALWNFGTDDFPWFKFEPLTDEQKIEITKNWNEMVKGGSVTKSDSDEAHIRRLLNMPEKTEEEEPEEEPGMIPGEEPEEEPDNEDWISAQPDDKADFIKKEFAEKPWLKRVNFARIEKTFDKGEKAFIADLTENLAKVRKSIEYQIVKITGDRSLGTVNTNEYADISIPKGQLSNIRKATRTNLAAVWTQNEAAAKKELPKKAFKRIGPGMDKGQADKYLASKAMKITDVIEKHILEAVQQILENGIKYDKTLKQIIDQLDTELTGYLPTVDAAGRAVNVPARLELIARTNIADAVNQARQSVFTHPDLKGFIQAYEYSAILDDRVSDICEHLNGKILKEFSEYTPPNHFQCRSILIPVTVVDGWDGKESPKPRQEPHKGFG